MNKNHTDITCLCGANLSDKHFLIFSEALRKFGNYCYIKCVKCGKELKITRLKNGYKVNKKSLRLREIKE